MKTALKIFGAVLAAYLVARGVVELFTLDFGSPASYRHDWGGPSVWGVLAVHTGPAVLILAALAAYLVRRRPA